MRALAASLLLASGGAWAAPPAPDFPAGTATPSEACGACHRAIYREFAYGFGSDLRFKDTTLPSEPGRRLSVPQGSPATATAHALAGVDSFPIHAREAEVGGRSCNVCHFPEPFALPSLDAAELAKPTPRGKDREAGGLTCASCHLTPDGKIRGPYAVQAPHATVEEPAMRTSAMCAYCHSMGKRVPGKQTQTFLEWREDFYKAGLGRQHCQDCHMPRTIRALAEDAGTPERAVGRHLWTGGHSFQRLHGALSLVVEQPEAGKPGLSFHLSNIGAGHSVPTGSNRRAVYLSVAVRDASGADVADREWMFAPSFKDRPDDKAFLEEDKKLPEAVQAMQADAQGPHEAPVRAGEERVLPWTPDLRPGDYAVDARLVYDLNRYNDRSFADDQTEFYRAQTRLTVAAGR